MTSLGVIADGVASAETDPLREGTVLSHLLGEDTLNSECLVCAHCYVLFFLCLLKVFL